jgi:hypothetical protein
MAEIEAGLAELDADQTVSQKEAEERYLTLLQRRRPIGSSGRAEKRSVFRRSPGS